MTLLVEDMVSCAGSGIDPNCEDYAMVECHGCGSALCLNCKYHQAQCEDFSLLFGQTGHG